MAKYGRIEVDNISLTGEMFRKVCEQLKLITNHCYQDDKTFYIYGIDDDKTQFNVECGADTKQSDCFLGMVRFRMKNFPREVTEGLSISYKI